MDNLDYINIKMKTNNLAYKVLENYQINMINLIDNYLENKQLINNCLNYQGDFERNLKKNINHYKNNENGLIIYNDNNNKDNKILYNSMRNLFHTSLYNYFNHIRKDYPYNTTELLTFIYIQQKKIDILEKKINNLNPQSHFKSSNIIISFIIGFSLFYLTKYYI